MTFEHNFPLDQLTAYALQWVRNIPSLFAIIIFGLSHVTLAQELSIESGVDETPVELKKLSVRANALETRIREVEQRIADSHQKLIGLPSERSVEYRIDLKPGIIAAGQSNRSIAVSHLRTSMNGRPYVYTQSAVILGPESPLPIFLGRISEGTHLVKIQLQAAPVSSALIHSSTAPWQTLDKVFSFEVSAEAGNRQNKILEIVEKNNTLVLEEKTLSASDLANMSPGK